MTPSRQRIPEWHDDDEELFRNEILTQDRPAVLKGLVRHWPAVRDALTSPKTICRYLCSLDQGNEWNAVLLTEEQVAAIRQMIRLEES